MMLGDDLFLFLFMFLVEFIVSCCDFYQKVGSFICLILPVPPTSPNNVLPLDDENV